MKTFPILASLIFFSLISSASADTKAKRLIFDDCEETKAALQTIEPDEVDNFLGYLEKVISLPTGSASELLHEPDPIGFIPATPLQRSGHPGIEEFKGNSISRTLEPSREIEAKRCAAAILVGYGEKGARRIPILVPLLEDQSLPDDVRVSIKQDIESMLKASREAKSPVVQELQPSLFQLSLENQQPSFKEIFLLLGEESIPFLVQEFFGPENARASLADVYLEKLNPTRANSLPLIEIAFRQSSPAIQDRALGFISQWKILPLSLFDEMLSKYYQEGGESTAKLLEAVVKQEEGTDARFDSLDLFRRLIYQTALAKEFSLRSGFDLVLPVLRDFGGEQWKEVFVRQNEFNHLFLRIVSRSLKAFDVRENIKEYVQSLPGELRLVELPLLAVFSPMERETFELCKTGLYSFDTEIREASFDCLGNSAEFAEEKYKTLLQFLKSPSERRDEPRRRDGVLQTLDVLSRLSSRALQKPFLVYASEAVDWEPLPPRSFLELGSGILRTEPRGSWEILLRENLDAVPAAIKKTLADGKESRVQAVLSFLQEISSSMDQRLKAKIRPMLDSSRNRFSGNVEIQAKIAEIVMLLDSLPRSQAAIATPSPRPESASKPQI